MSKKPDRPTDAFSRVPIPGGTNLDSGITIRGGTSNWYKPEELPPRRSRAMQEAGIRMGSALERMSKVEETEEEGTEAATVTLGDTKFKQSDVAMMAALRESDIAAMLDLNDMSIWAYIKDWTLTRPVYVIDPKTEAPMRDADGNLMPPSGWEPMPIPESYDDYLDFPVETYEALQRAAGRIYALARRESGSGFTVDSVEDPNSPTGASAGSKAPSAEATGEPLTPSPLPGTPSTSS